MKKDEETMHSKNVKRGQIFMADLGKSKGSVQAGVRPVLVVSNPMNNKFSPTVNVLPITSRVKNNIPVHINIKGAECGLEKDSTILTEQMLTIDKTQLLEPVGFATNKILKDVAKATILQTSLDLELAYA